MINVILVTHGPLASAYKTTVNMLIGDYSEAIIPVCFDEEDDTNTLRAKLEDILKNTPEGTETIIVTDIISGTPFNVVTALLRHYDFEHITGINLPVLIEILFNIDSVGSNELVAMALEVADGSIIDAKKRYLERRSEK